MALYVSLNKVFGSWLEWLATLEQLREQIQNLFANHQVKHCVLLSQWVLGHDDLLADQVVDGSQDEAIQHPIGHGDCVLHQHIEGIDALLNHLVQVPLNDFAHHWLIDGLCDQFTN